MLRIGCANCCASNAFRNMAWCKKIKNQCDVSLTNGSEDNCLDHLIKQMIKLWKCKAIAQKFGSHSFIWYLSIYMSVKLLQRRNLINKNPEYLSLKWMNINVQLSNLFFWKTNTFELWLMCFLILGAKSCCFIILLALCITCFNIKLNRDINALPHLKKFNIGCIIL